MGWRFGRFRSRGSWQRRSAEAIAGDGTPDPSDLRSAPIHPDELVPHAYQLLADGDAIGAERAARSAIRRDPFSSRGHAALAHALIAQGRSADARAAASEAITVEPRDARGHVAMAAAWLLDRRLDEALTAGHRAVAADPHLADAHYVLGSALEMQGQKRAAREAFDRVMTLEPDHVAAAERISADRRAPLVGAVSMVAIVAFQGLRIFGWRFSDRTVAGFLLIVAAAFVAAVLFGLRRQRARLANLNPYARMVVELESRRRRRDNRLELVVPILLISAIIVGLSVSTVLFATGQKPTLGLAVGDCFSTDQRVSIEQIATIPCTLPHDIEVFAVLADPAPSGAPYPGIDAVHAAARIRCESLYPSYVGVAFDRRAPTQIKTFVPEESYWVIGIRSLFCGLSDPRGGQLIGSRHGFGPLASMAPSARP